MNKNKVIFILAIIPVILFAFYFNAYAKQVGDIQVSDAIGKNNSEILSNALNKLSVALNNINLLLAGKNIDKNNAIILSSTLGNIKSTLSSVNLSIKELAYEYVNNNLADNNKNVANNNNVAENIENAENSGNTAVPGDNAISKNENNSKNGMATMLNFKSNNIVVGIIISLLFVILLLYVFVFSKDNKNIKIEQVSKNNNSSNAQFKNNNIKHHSEMHHNERSNSSVNISEYKHQLPQIHS